MGYDSVILDFDGVIIDSAFDDYGWADAATREKAAELGYRVDERVEPLLFRCRSHAELCRKIADKPFSLEEYRQIEQAACQRKIELVEDGELPVLPGAIEALERIEAPIAVASNGYGEALDRIIEELGLDAHIEYWTAPRLEQFETYPELRKPQTTLLERAVGAIGGHDPVMVGDSDSDIAAADRLGIGSVFIETYDHKQPRREPDHRIERLTELVGIVGDGDSGR